MIRSVSFTLLGFVAGVLAGIVTAFLAVLLWFDVLGIGNHGADGLSGFAAFMALSLIFGLVGGVIGAVLVGRRANRGQGEPVGLPIIIGMVVILVLGLFFLRGAIL